MWISLLIAAALLIGLLFGLYLLQRSLKGAPRGPLRPNLPPLQTGAKAGDLEQLIAAYHRDKAHAAPAEAVASAAPAARPAAPTARVAATIKPKASFLAGPNKLLFQVLHSALSDHQIFPNVRLVDAVQIVGQPPTPQQRAQLAQARVDFVICTKQLNVVALLDVSDGNRADDVLKRQLEPQITGAGGRYLRIAPNAIPQPAEVRALVCGA